MSEFLKLSKQEHTAIITFNNPPAHTWTKESLTHLRDIVLSLNEDKDVYALIITGDGNKFFSAGADLKLFAAGSKDVAREMSKHLKLCLHFVVSQSQQLTATRWAAGWK